MRLRNHVFLDATGENLAGALGFELRTSVLETGVLPIETTRLRYLRFAIFNLRFGFELNQHIVETETKSQIENRKYLE